MEDRTDNYRFIDDYIKGMSLDEKIELIAGDEFDTKPNKRLGIPSLKMTDGPVGVRWGCSIAFPAGIAMAATWNTNLINKLGKALALETLAKGRNVILGPCVNIARVPHGGRNFESFGEDPYLTSRIAVDYIKGVQSEKVIATVKHFACNNQEYERRFVDVKIDERTLNEIYLPAFKSAVKEAKVLAVMSAYNKLNGAYCSESHSLLNKKLKDEWGFKGLVMSDWGAVHSSEATAKNGLDLEMPNGKYLNHSNLLGLIKEGIVKESVIDEKIRRLLYVMSEIGLFDNSEPQSPLAHEKLSKEVAYQSAVESIVLLKNENELLPLNIEKIKSLAIIGQGALTARIGGGGSSKVSTTYSVSPIEALKNRLGDNIEIKHRLGSKLNGDVFITDDSLLYAYENDEETFGIYGEYFDNPELKGKPANTRIDQHINFNWGFVSPIENVSAKEFSVRWIGYLKITHEDNYIFEISSEDGVRLYINDKLVIDDWTIHSAKDYTYKVKLNPDKKYQIRLEYFQSKGEAVVRFRWKRENENLLEEAVKISSESDAVIIFAGTSHFFETEGKDREDITLPNMQDELIEAISKVNKNVIVVLNTGSPVVMDKWVNKVDSIVESWFGGSETGNAIADILLGKYNPSGKLPVTFPKRWEDCSAFNTYKSESGITNYSDGIFVGYRHFDENNIEPLFPFGYGLSYTKFEYSDLSIQNLSKPKEPYFEVEVNIRNIGKLEGADVVQLYISKVNSEISRAEKELKAFSKIDLKSGESKQINFILKKESFEYFNIHGDNWMIEEGDYKIMIGSSSRDIRAEDVITIE